jgi:hypothetical protein
MKSFGKQSNCPTSHDILSYTEGGLRSPAMQRIARHCALCDFCGAEAQLVAKFKPSEEDHTPAPMPALISVLGINMPLRRTPAVERRRAA